MMPEMKDRYWILDGKEVRPVSMMVWAEFFEASFEREKNNRILRQEYYQRHGKRIFVSTVFLGLDHNWNPDGPPHIFETMVFDGKGKCEEISYERWSTYDQAIAGHEMLMQRAKVEILGCKLKVSY